MVASPRVSNGEETGATDLPASAKQPAEDGDRASILVRKIYVPGAHPAKWPTDGRAFLPLGAERLEKLLAMAATDNSSRPRPGVTTAVFYAKLDTNNRLVGHGILDIAKPAQPSSWLRFEPGRLQLTSARWRNFSSSASSSSSADDAELGYWGEAGELALRVAQPGKLDLEWRLSPRLRSSQQRDYEVTLPAAIATTLIVDLPTVETPVPLEHSGTLATIADEAILRRAMLHLGSSEVHEGLPEPPPGTTRWALSCGPSGRLAWHLGRTIESAPKLAPSMSEELHYKIDPSGLTLHQRLVLGVDGTLPQTLAFAVPENVVLTGALWDGDPIPWTVDVPNETDTAGETYRLAPPVAPSTTPSTTPTTEEKQTHTLELQAWCPVVLERAWQLPQLTTHDLFWSEGRVDFELASSIRMDDLILQSVSQISPPGGAERIARFQKVRTSGSLKVHLSRQLPTAKIAMGSVVRLSGAGSKASIVAHIQSAGNSPIHFLQAKVTPGWEIQSVESFTKDLIDDWYLTEYESGERQLTIRLSVDPQEATEPELGSRRAADENRPSPPPAQRNSGGEGRVRGGKFSSVARLIKLKPIELTIHAKRQKTERQKSALDEYIPMKENVALEWLDASMSNSFLSLESDEGYQIDFLPSPAAVAEEQLLSHLGSLLPASPSGDVFDMQQTSNVKVHLSARNATFSSEVVMEIVDGTNEQGQATWNPTCRITCLPLRGLVSRLAFTLPSESQPPLRWKLKGSDEWRNATQRFDIDPAAGGAWELLLPQPRSSRFTVIVDWDPSSDDTLTAWPPTLLGTTTQTTQFWVHTESPGRIALDATGLTLVPSAAVPRDTSLPLHSAWQAPAPDASGLQENSRLVLHRQASKSSPPRARINNATLESTYAPASPSRHQYRFTVQNDAETEIRCQLPEAAMEIHWQRVPPSPRTSLRERGPGRGWLSPTTANRETPPASQPSSSDAVTFSIPLPRAPGSASYLIEFALPDEPLVSGAERHAPWPRLSLPVEVGEWRIWLPRDFVASSPEIPQVAPTWQERLLGPFAQRSRSAGNRSESPAASAFHSLTLQSAHAGPMSVTLVNLPRRKAIQIILLMLAMATGYGLWRKPTYFVTAIAISAIASLLVPHGWLDLATACWGGLLGSAAIRGLQLGLRSAKVALEDPTTIPANPSQATLTTTLFLALATLLCGGTALCGGAAAAELPAMERAEIERVLIPVDAQGHATGEQFITPRLMRNLLEREQLVRAERDWMISRATYEGSIDSPAESLQFTKADWILTFELQVFRKNVTVELPLRKADAEWSANLTLDGMATKVMWGEEGKGCRFRVRASGKYRVKIICRPKIASEGTHQSIRMHLPPLPLAVLKLTTAPSVEGMDLAGELLASDGAADGTRSIRLDSTPELTLRWLRPISDEPQDDWRVEQYEWMQLGPDNVQVDYFVRLRGTKKDLPPVEFVSSEPARMILLPRLGTPSVEIPPARRRWTIDTFPEQDGTETGTVTYVARFRLILDRAQPMGRIRFPKLTLPDMPTTNWSQAVSHSEELSVAIDASSPPAIDIDVEEFVSIWPDRSPPEIAISADSSETPLAISVRSVVRVSSPDEKMQIGCFEDRLRIQYQGDYPQSTKPRFRQVLRISPGLRIDSVEFRRNGESTPIRYSLPQPDRLVVFFSDSAPMPFRLSVEASLPVLASKTNGDATRPSGVFDLPRLTSWSHPPAAQRLFLFSAPHLAATFGNDDPPQPLADLPLVVPNGWDVYGEGAFQVSAHGTTPPTIVVEENKPRFDAAVVTTLIRADDNWTAEFGIALDVTRGTLSAVTLELPDSLSDVLDVDPPVYIDLQQPAAAERRQLTLRFPQAVRAGETYRATIRCNMRVPNPRIVRSPRLDILEAKSVDRYFGIPPSRDGKWSSSGASPTAATAAIESFLVAHPATQLLVARNDQQTDVRWTAHEKIAKAQRLPLVEVHAKLSPGGAGTLRTCLALPALDNDQGEIDQCEINLPESHRLLSARIDGASAVVQATKEGTLRLSLPGTRQPHVVEFVTTTEQLPGSGSLVLQAPGLSTQGTPLEPEHYLWSVADLRTGKPLTSTSAESRSSVDHAALRLNQLLKTSAIATNDNLHGPTDSQAIWAASWAQVLDGAVGEMRKALSAAPPKEIEIVGPSSSATEFDELLARAEGRIGRLQELAPKVLSRERQATWPLITGDEPIGWVSFVVTGDQRLELEFAPDTSTDGSLRWGLAGAIFLATVVFLKGAPRVSWPAPNEAYVFPAVAIAGFAWWLWLWPAWAGLIVAIASLLAWLRWSRHRW